MSPSIIILVYAIVKVLLHTWNHFRLKNFVNPMQQLYALRTVRHVAFQKPDFANFPDVVTYKKNMASLYPPQTVFVGGYTVFMLSIRPNVCP